MIPPTGSKKLIIDERLVGNRNRVAHGEQYLEIQPDDYAGLHDDISPVNRVVPGTMWRMRRQPKSIAQPLPARETAMPNLLAINAGRLNGNLADLK